MLSFGPNLVRPELVRPEQCSMLHANCTVHWTMQLAWTVHEKQEFLAFLSLRLGRKNNMGPMHSKSRFHLYQTVLICDLIKTQPQPQPRKQMGSKWHCSRVVLCVVMWLRKRDGILGSFFLKKTYFLEIHYI